MSPLANPLVAATAEPAILEARAWLAEYDGRLGPELDLSQAAPPYAASDALLERLAAAAGDSGTARYGAVRGEAGLKQAYCEHLRTIYEGRFEPDNITVTAGCNQAFFITALTLLQRGDSVLLPAPWYFNHKMTLDMLGIGVKPLLCEPEAGYLPDIEAAEAAIDRGVRAVVLVTPNNPTGAEYPAELIERFYDLCRRKGIWLILDETYRDFRREIDSMPHRLVSPDWPEGLVSLYSFSKGYAVPGHRLGTITAPVGLGSEILKVQDCVQICAGRAVQIAMTWGLANLGSWQAERRRDVAKAQAALRSALNGTGWSLDGSGAYFAYLRHPFVGLPAQEIAAQLARECGILVLAGSSFGPGQCDHVRLSFPSLTPTTSEMLRHRLNMFAERRRGRERATAAPRNLDDGGSAAEEISLAG